MELGSLLLTAHQDLLDATGLLWDDGIKRLV